MKDETSQWIRYAEENLLSAKCLLANNLYNPCLQNVQQCIEKSLKSVLIENSIRLKKTHSIFELKNILSDNGIEIEISDDDCEFLDSIYIPSKYPVSSVLPHFEPDAHICNKGISIASQVFDLVKNIVK